MNARTSTRFYQRLSLACLVVLLLAPLGGAALAASQAAPVPPVADRLVTGTVTLPPGADVIVELPRVDKGAYPKLESQLAQLYESAVLSTGRSLETFSGERHIDLAAGTARVIIEMDVDPQARQVGPPTIETVALPGGRTARIEHAAPTAVRADLAAAIAATGATYELAIGDLVQVLAPFDSLEALSKIAGVRVVRLPFPAQEQDVSQRAPSRPLAGPAAPQVGAQTTEGVGTALLPLTNTYAWHALGYDGANVNLAVFDFGFTGWAALQTSGDLPSGGNLVNKDHSSAYSFSPDTSGYAHGAACAETAYDMAPGSTVYLYAWGTDAEFASAVDDYRNNVSGKRVATMSISWVNAGPYDGTGSTSAPDTKVNQARDAGIFWANAAGNYRTQHNSWTSARYSTSDTVAFGTGNIEGIGPDDGSNSLWNLTSGTTLRIYLEWNDWNADRTGNENHVDYDICLWRWTGSAWSSIGCTATRQCTTTATPTEGLGYTVSTAGGYGITIQRYTSGCTNNFGHWMELFTFNGFYTAGTGMVSSWWYRNPCNSLTIPADADGAVATGATFWNEDGNATYDYGLETFSSFGPRNASGGANPSGAVNKPDVVAPDGVSTATYGASNGTPYRTSGHAGFFGTSGAAPHVAGMAATVWEKNPGGSLADLRTYIQAQALYKAAGGTCGGSLAAAAAPQAPMSTVQNNRYGWGRINLPSSPTGITLASMNAAEQGNAIEVTWDTVSEFGNAGFNLYRDTSEAGPGIKINTDLIPSQAAGSQEGYHYSYLDNGWLAPDTTYYYWLEDVSTTGVATRHEPVSVLYTGSPTAVGLGRFGATPALPALPIAALLVTALVAGAAVARRRGRK